MASKQHYSIELVEEYENVNFYSIHLMAKNWLNLRLSLINTPSDAITTKKLMSLLHGWIRLPKLGLLKGISVQRGIMEMA